MTARRVVTTNAADRDVLDAVDHYVGEGADDAAMGFVDAFEDATTLLASYSSIGSSRFAVELNMPELRSLALPRYPFVLFYSDDIDVVRIHRVLHSARDIPSALTER